MTKINITIIFLVLTLFTMSQNNILIEKVETKHIPQDNLFDKLSKYLEKQVFYINNSVDTILFGNKGTEIAIPSNCFNINSESLIRIELTELFEMDEMIMSNLSTLTTDNEILQTFGMLKLEAFQNSKVLAMKEGFELSVRLPVENNSDEIKLFNGLVKDNNVYWIDSTKISSIKNISSYSFITYKLKHMIQLGYNYKLNNYLYNNLEYPIEALNEGICGEVIVSFQIDVNGNIFNTYINEKSKSLILDNYALELVNNCVKIPPIETKERKALKNGYRIHFKFSMDKCSKGFKTYELSKFQINNQMPLVLRSNIVRDSSINIKDSTKVKMLVYNISQLGWLNIDKLRKLNGRKGSLSIKHSYSNNVDFKLILPKYTSIIPANKTTETEYIFNKLPENEDAILIGIKHIDSKIYLHKEAIYLNNMRTIETFNFYEITPDELRRILKSL